jgi:hypothetical protein
MLGAKTHLINQTLREKKLLMADILQIPKEDYNHIAEVFKLETMFCSRAPTQKHTHRHAVTATMIIVSYRDQ